MIRGSAVNNDGADKISFTASSVPGQARAMVEAMGVAQVDAGEIDYVECHGTGTTIGDPLEIGALTRAFRTATDRQGFCAVGSVKSNFGHLEQCAGMAGLIKTALSLHHQAIPPSLHYRKANPKIDFDDEPVLRQHADARMDAQRARASCRRQFARARRHQCVHRAGGSAGAGFRLAGFG